jgi:8-oxo-dGTP pyrophosphatase MutT (NUDIX family)
MATPDVPQAWRKLASERGPEMIVFRARFDRLVNPRNGRETRATVLEAPDWVNVVALTAEEEVVLIRQYRFGAGHVTLEIPGGCVDDGEEHGDAARRELREEAGFTSDDWTYLGCVEPNPAVHDNLCHHWLARGARRTHAQELDAGEDIQVLTLPVDEVRRAAQDGGIRHALVLTALSRVIDLRRVP